ncbi:MAG: glycosyltransferase family 4 protein, partial [Candidatus Latescibacteria bacterium]|nr:glycosyltransferase family 4 protein [Candidatus Latescibacterota bacterium]
AYHPALGGVTEHVDATALALRDRGHEVTVITSRFARIGSARGAPAGLRYAPEADGDEAARGGPGAVEVVRIGRNVVVPFNGAESNVSVGFGLKRKLAAVLSERNYDLVHVHCPLSPTLPLVALRVARQPIVGTFHATMFSDLPFRLFGRALLPYFRRIDRALAVSETAHACVARHFPGPIEIVPNGVNLERFRPGLARLEGFDEGIPNLLFVGRHDPRKGLPELMTACARLAKRGLPFRLIVVGDGWMRRRVERMARGPLSGRVHFEGRVGNDRLPRYYASADIFCSPARGGESFGIVLLEAMASGVPVVATDLPGYRTVLAPGAQGLAVPPRDPAALAGALGTLLLDPRMRRDMGDRGIETARRYAWPVIVERLEEIYHSLVGAGHRTRRMAEVPERPALLEPAQA